MVFQSIANMADDSWGKKKKKKRKVMIYKMTLFDVKEQQWHQVIFA